MPRRKNLSPEQNRQIGEARGKQTPKKPSKPKQTPEKPSKPKQKASATPKKAKKSAAIPEMAGAQNSKKNTQQMPQDMDIFLGGQEILFEHVQNFEETQEDLLDTIQKNSRAAKKLADKIVDTAAAATAAACSVLKAVSIVGGVAGVLFFLQKRRE